MASSPYAGSQWLERLLAVHRNLTRRFANEEGLQLVHLEIMQYLSVSNRYSDTTQTISEYLGQTKGSISQSISLLEEQGFIKRSQDKIDKRIYHLLLTTKGTAVIHRMFAHIDLKISENIESSLKALLTSIQNKHGLLGFGTCISCKYNQNHGKNIFVCGLTKEKLTLDDTMKICKEHESIVSG